MTRVRFPVSLPLSFPSSQPPFPPPPFSIDTGQTVWPIWRALPPLSPPPFLFIFPFFFPTSPAFQMDFPVGTLPKEKPRIFFFFFFCGVPFSPLRVKAMHRTKWSYANKLFFFFFFKFSFFPFLDKIKKQL